MKPKLVPPSAKQLSAFFTVSCLYIALVLICLNDLRTSPEEEGWLYRSLFLPIVLGLLIWLSGGVAKFYFVVGGLIFALLFSPFALYGLHVGTAPTSSRMGSPPIFILEGAAGALHLEMYFSMVGGLIIGSFGLLRRRQPLGLVGLIAGLGFFSGWI